jgi:hypothetical protein
MANKNSSTRDVSVNSITIVTSGGKVFDVSQMFNVLNIYEDIFSSVVTGTIQIVDAAGMYAQLELHGNEFIFVSFNRPNTDDKYKRSFRIYKASDKKPGESQGQTYVLHFCSEELIFSNSQSISKSFKGKVITEYVRSICTGNLRINTNRIGAFENSIGIQDVIIPRMSPLDAIQYFAENAFDHNESTFLFFENVDGFNFLPLTSLVRSDPLITLQYSNAKLTEDETTAAYQNANKISNFRFTNSFDMMETSKNMTYSGKLYTLDILRQKYVEKPYSASKMNKVHFIDGANFPINNAPNRNNKAIFTEYDSHINYSMTNHDQSNAPYLLSKAYRVTDTNVENTLLQRKSQLNLLKNTKIECIVPGNILFTVGRVVNMDMPAFTRSTQAERTIDPYYSGKYLITNTRHVITPSGGHQTILNLAKNSLASSLDRVVIANKEYVKARDL